MLTRSQRTVRRIVILGEAGTLSLAAVRWCVDTGITIVQLDSTGRTLATTVGDTPREARLRRAQALATTTETGLQVARFLVNLKIQGHATNLTERFDGEGQEAASRLLDLAAEIPATATIVELRDVEARAASLYFGAWERKVAAQFATRDAARVPGHWQSGNPRTPRHQKYGRRRATDPTNALLNYAYKLAEIECRIACVAVGLDPDLGVMHADIKHRSSMALDLLEALRPEVERTVLDLIAAHRFRAHDFIETPDGTCRLGPSVAHELISHLRDWGTAVGPVAEQVAHTIGATSRTVVRVRTPLTGAQQRAAQRAHPAEPEARAAQQRRTTAQIPRSCIDCGEPVGERRAKRCRECDRIWRASYMTELARKTQRERSFGAEDPSQSDAARSARSASLRAERAARIEWDRTHIVTAAAREQFETVVVPNLEQVTLSRISAATGVSLAAASRIRRGLLKPHPRHWDTLRTLAFG